MLRPKEFIIGDHNWKRYAADPKVGGETKRRGLIPRDWKTVPAGAYAGARQVLDMPLIPRSEWAERAADQIKGSYRLSDFRLRGDNGKPIPSRDQNGRGYCWMHSGVSAVLMLRASLGLPYADLSAYAGACIIKNYRDQGGWGAQGLDFLVARGIPTAKYWPQKSVSRANDNPETWADAAKYRVLEGWIDMASAQYDRNLTFDQEITLLLSNIPTIKDHNWWGHSIGGADAVNGETNRKHTRMKSGKLATLKEFELIWGFNDPVTAGWGIRIWNSWSDDWGDLGMSVLTGSKAVSDGCTAPRALRIAA